MSASLLGDGYLSPGMWGRTLCRDVCVCFSHILDFICTLHSQYSSLVAGKESACNVGDLGLNSGLGRSPGEGKGSPFQCSGLENFMECIVHGVAKSWTGLSNFHFHFDIL